MRRAGAGVAVLAALAPAGPGASRAAAPPARLMVTATEFRFALSRATLAPGPALVQLANRGQDAHDLVLRRLDGAGRPVGRASPPALTRSGGVTTTALRLRPGHYVLFCSATQCDRCGGAERTGSVGGRWSVGERFSTSVPR